MKGARYMSKVIDLTGKRFGKLTVTKRAKNDKYGNASWICECDCGKEIIASANNLKSGGTKSCGCLKKENTQKFATFPIIIKGKGYPASTKDISGKLFGRLTAIEPTDKRLGHSVVWKCICDCGKEIFIGQKALSTGDTKSCGCLDAENRKAFVDAVKNDNISKCYEGTMLISLTDTLYKNNTSGRRGVSWNTAMKAWETYIWLKRKKIMLGFFTNLEDAIKAREEAEQKYWAPILEKYESVSEL
jgi:hypothetical protein